MESYSLSTSKNQQIDLLLDDIFKQKTNGFFIELGANDGLTFSNSAFFEFHRGWKGILIEPSLNAYNKCVKNRPNSKCFNLVCVSDDYKDKTIKGDFNGGMMCSVDGKRNNTTVLVECKVSTLEKILDSVTSSTEGATTIDFLSLDTEGYEYNILCGLNLNKYRPKYMLIEIYVVDYVKITAFLEDNNYKLVDNITNYNKQDNPGWDGTHNDYLFIDSLPSST